MRINNVQNQQSFKGAFSVVGKIDRSIPDPEVAVRAAEGVALRAAKAVEDRCNELGIDSFTHKDTTVLLLIPESTEDIPRDVVTHSFLTYKNAESFKRDVLEKSATPMDMNIPAENSFDALSILEGLKNGTFDVIKGMFIKQPLIK